MCNDIVGVSGWLSDPAISTIVHSVLDKFRDLSRTMRTPFIVREVTIRRVLNHQREPVLLGSSWRCQV